VLKGDIISFQLALFFSELDKRPDRFIKKFDAALGDVFDEMPVILPIPEDAPPEIPSVILKSSDGTYTCNIARSRIDILLKTTSIKTEASEYLDRFFDFIKIYSAVVFGSKEVERFGFIGQYFFEDGEPVQKIQSKYFKTNLGKLEELNIRFNKRFSTGDLIMNDVVEISKAEVNNEGTTEKRSGVFIHRDLNNVTTEDLLDMDNVLSIIKANKNSFDAPGIVGLIL
jgi:hypothetical protein